MLKRLISMLIGIAILIIVMALNNELIFNISVTIISILGLYEFYSATRHISIKPVKWIGYLSSFLIVLLPYISINSRRLTLIMYLPVLILILFSISLLEKMKRSITDISVTLFGIIYITFLLSFLVFTRQMNNGTYYVWFILGGAWFTDTFAYTVGVLTNKFTGNHKFSKISPNKSIEGCIGGIIGCVVFFVAYTYYLRYVGIELNYILMAIIGMATSVIAQIGDFAASSIKRHCKIKDFGYIMPGHGGVLDRFDSIIFVAPFIYVVFNVII